MGRGAFSMEWSRPRVIRWLACLALGLLGLVTLFTLQLQEGQRFDIWTMTTREDPSAVARRLSLKGLPLPKPEPLPPLILLRTLYAVHLPLPFGSLESSVLGSPSIALTHWLTRGIVVGVMGFDRPRIEMITATWGRYLQPGSLFFYADTPWPGNPAVVNLVHPRPGVEVTDRRGSAWKILPAVRHMYETAPADALWFYLCDDDSYPLVHMLATLAGEYDSSTEVYAGESTGQNTYFKAYYADEEASGKVGRWLNLRYQCTGGGVLFSRAMLEKLVPFLHECPVFFASDVSLGHCLNEHAGVKEVTRITTQQHAYPRTPEEVQKKYSSKEAILTQALAYHHMKPSFIYQDAGVPEADSPHQYMQDTERRMYPAWMHQLAVLRLKAQQNSGYSASMAWTGVQQGGVLKGSTLTQARARPPNPVGALPLLRVAYVHAVEHDPLESGFGVDSLAKQFEKLFLTPSDISTRLPFGAGLFAPHAFQTDYIPVRLGCQACASYSVNEAYACHTRTAMRVYELFPRLALTKARRGVSEERHGFKAQPLRLHEIDWSAYDLIISTKGAIFPMPLRNAYARTTVFAHRVSEDSCKPQPEEELKKRPAPQKGLPDPAPSIPLRDSAVTDSSLVGPSLSFPLASPFLFGFFGMFHLFDVSSSGSSMPPPNVITEALHHRPDRVQVELLMVDRSLAELGPQERERLVAAMAGASIGSPAGSDLALRKEAFHTARLCFFTTGLAEWSSIPPEQADALRDSILLAVSVGCHALFSEAVGQLHPVLKALASDPPLRSLADVIALLPRLLRDTTQPFPTRRGLIEVGRQRMALNQHCMDQPLDQLLQAAAEQLHRQRRAASALAVA